MKKMEVCSLLHAGFIQREPEIDSFAEIQLAALFSRDAFPFFFWTD
jgi:hypothetical protein